jgi:hypothetical protein
MVSNDLAANPVISTRADDEFTAAHDSKGLNAELKLTSPYLKWLTM